MKNICILGWYGTETLGDRAILDGIFQIFNSLAFNMNINIASLNSNFTKRTFFEDGEIYSKNSPNLNFEIFDVYNNSELKRIIKNSDLVIMGGGPIMDLNELALVEKSFKIAKRYNKKTMLFGCGIGPLNQKKYINIAKRILKKSDLSIFRDKNSINTANEICMGEYYSNMDPAVVSVLKYINENKKEKLSENNIAINFRMITNEYNVENKFEEYFTNIISYASKNYDNVILVPMHTFSVGGDDRRFLTKLKNNLSCDNVSVIHKPMNLYELYSIYQNSSACIGMRYHSIVLQTFLNGNNIIIDYTSKKKGKIISFLKDIDSNNFYKNRYINILNIRKNMHPILDVLKENEEFNYDKKLYDDVILYYKEKIEGLFDEK